jgi:alkyldihydroxyacetonephosphate synthase
VMGLGDGSGAALLLAFESQLDDPAVVDSQLAAAAAIAVEAGGARRAERHGGSKQGGGEEGDGKQEGAAEWKASFTRAPAARDELLLRGLLAETFETAVVWSRLEALHSNVTAAVRAAAEALDVPVLVTCRLTHVYTDGCAPYFTVVSPEVLSAPKMLQVWAAIKKAANRARTRSA